MLQRAIEIAKAAHAGQTDKAGRPYIDHPLRVMERLAQEDLPGRIVAVLHDVLEDTETTLEALRSEGFPEAIRSALECLTHRTHEPRSEYWSRVGANPLARRVKLADIADNSDEARLTLLAPEIAQRLREKYRAARAALGSIG